MNGRCGSRHWFTRDGMVTPTCVRCGAANQRITARQLAEWEATEEARLHPKHWERCRLIEADSLHDEGRTDGRFWGTCPEHGPRKLVGNRANPRGLWHLVLVDGPPPEVAS